METPQHLSGEPAHRARRPGIVVANTTYMPTRTRSRVVRTVTDAMWERDKLQMRIIDKLLAAVRPVRKRAAGTRRTVRRRR
jgi:hypothetical protein